MGISLDAFLMPSWPADVHDLLDLAKMFAATLTFARPQVAELWNGCTYVYYIIYYIMLYYIILCYTIYMCVYDLYNIMNIYIYYNVTYTYIVLN